MEGNASLLWEVSVVEFLVVTVVLAGAAAFLTGRAIALVWERDSLLILYILLLTAATRFFHSALFEGTLLSLHYFIVDFVVLLFMAFIGKRLTRSRQMVQQYGFLSFDAESGLANALPNSHGNSKDLT